MSVKLAFYTVKTLGILGRVALDRDIWPFWGILSVDFQPFVQPGFSVGFNGICGALRLTHTTIDTFIRVDDQHVFALVEAIDGAHFHAIHIFALDAVFGDDVGHDGPLVFIARG